MGGGKKVVIEPHRHAGIFIARGKEDALVTKNMVLGESVYGEKRIAVEEDATKLEYRVWNPFRSKLAAAVLGGVDNIHMPPGSKVSLRLSNSGLYFLFSVSGPVSGSCQRHLRQSRVRRCGT